MSTIERNSLMRSTDASILAWVLAVGLGFNIACLCLWKYAPLLLTTMT